MGDFENCGCDDSRNGQIGGRGWIWGGCSDNVKFGERISKEFVDALETGQDVRAAMNLHNKAAGRMGNDSFHACLYYPCCERLATEDAFNVAFLTPTSTAQGF
ncbi:UNVERIFIED_CONTAM: hypothetical protein FKN15_035684 [Acipenser sinensis]